MSADTEIDSPKGPTVEIPLGEIERVWVEDFRNVRVANKAAYLTTSDGQFTTRVSNDIADQRTYLEHQINHSQVRVRAFVGDYAGKLPEDLSVLSREELIRIFDDQTQQLAQIFRKPDSLTRTVTVPYAGRVTGMAVLVKTILHEAKHLGLNEGTLGHFGVERPPEVIKPFGK